jgi:hypothetical protein
MVEATLRELGGGALRVAYEHRDLADDGAETRPPSEDEIVARFKTAFDAEEIASDDEPQSDEREGEA